MNLLDFLKSHLTGELADRIHQELEDLKTRVAALELKEPKHGIGTDSSQG